MSKSIELQIHKILTDVKEVDLAADLLLRMIEKQSLKEEDCDSVASFLFTAGLFPTFIAHSLKNIERKKLVSWPFFAETILSKIPEAFVDLPDATIPKELLQAISNCAAASNDLDRLIWSPTLIKLEPKYGFLKQSSQNQEQNAYLAKRADLLSKIELFNQQKSLDAEREYIERFMRFFPKDVEGHRLISLLNEKKIQARIANRKKVKRAKLPEISIIPTEQVELLNLWFEESLEQIDISKETDDKIGSDFIYFFFFLEDYEHCLKIAMQEPVSLGLAWLMIEAMVKARQFADGLEWLSWLDQTFATEPNNYLSITYYRALCYEGLGQTKIAIGLLQAILEQQPNYRMASTLYAEWSLGLE